MSADLDVDGTAGDDQLVGAHNISHVSMTNSDDTTSGTITTTLQVVESPELDSSAAKRPRLDSFTEDITDTSIKQILFNINKAVCLRLDGIENKLDVVNVRTKYLEEKIDQIHNHLKNMNSGGIKSETRDLDDSLVGSGARRSSAFIVGLPQNRNSDSGQESLSPGNQSLQNLGQNVTLITLNREEDYPQGSWLGDESNPEMRVRAPISPSDLLHIHSNCRTPEKMALTLLDYLFDRETQALSNLSGQGKHGKKQLDPLMIYGIRCHLITRFGITEQDWHRIKQNIDSKCRTAFRRRLRGQPMMVKAFRGKGPNLITHLEMGTMDAMDHSDDSMTNDEAVELRIHPGHHIDLDQADLPHTGEIQVLHATPEQLAQLQQTHQIQILQSDHVIQVAPNHESVHTVAVHIQPSDENDRSVDEQSLEADDINAMGDGGNNDMINSDATNSVVSSHLVKQPE